MILLLEYNENDPDLNEMDNSLVSFSNQTQSTKRLPLLVDFFIPPTNLVGFIDDLKILEKSLGMELALYGSYTTNNYSLRPKFNIEDPDFNKKAISFIRAGAYVIKRRNGELAGGAPEGRIKALITNDEMMADQMALYAGIKNIFDKYEILNPGVKLGADATYTVRHFRKS